MGSHAPYYEDSSTANGDKDPESSSRSLHRSGDPESSSRSLHRRGSTHPITSDKTEAKDLLHSDQPPNQGPQNHVIDNMESHLQANDPNPSAPSDKEQVAGQLNHPGNQDAPGKWSKTVFFTAVASILAALSISEYNVNGNGIATPKYLFRRQPCSFRFYLIVNMAAFYLSAILIAFEGASTALAKAIFWIAFTGVILSFTVLFWELLPDELSWLPWVFFVLTPLAIFGLRTY